MAGRGYDSPALISSAIGVNSPTTSSSSTSWTQTESRSLVDVRTFTHLIGLPTSRKPTSTAPPSSTTSTIPSKQPQFTQMVHVSEQIVYHVRDEELLSTSFDDICPSGNCIGDCSNISRVFQAVPEGISADPWQYGRLNSDGRSEVTLFGTCTNLEYAMGLEKTGAFSSHFPAEDVGELSAIASRITTCFATTCEQTRDPALCGNVCSASKLLSSATAFDYSMGVPNCIITLCGNTCSLPYVNPDVLGIGVLISYCIQAVLLIACASPFVISSGYQLWKAPDTDPKVKYFLKSPLETFLRVQTLFGISLAIATFITKPAEIDPLNGFPLILTSVMGFLPPVFTLLLLHSHGVRSRFSTALVLASYSLNSVTFYLLVRNLSTRPYDRKYLNEAINNLFSTEACDGRSAISLCYQLTGTDPVGFLTDFYDATSFVNIKTVPLLWVWATTVLLFLMSRRYPRDPASRNSSKSIGDLPPESPKSRRSCRGLYEYLKLLQSPLVTFLTLFFGTVVFCLCLAYQYLMVRANALMDVMDMNGWSFGQVVAVFFWAPPLVDVIRSTYESRKNESKNQESKKHESRKYEKVDQTQP